MTDPASKSVRVTLRMTGPMYANLRRIAGVDKDISSVIREAIRAYLDDRGELTGSRRYFTGSFRDEVRLLRQDLGWQLTLIAILLSEMLSLLITQLVPIDEKSKKSFSPSGILKLAEDRLVESGNKVRDRISMAIDKASSTSQE